MLPRLHSKTSTGSHGINVTFLLNNDCHLKSGTEKVRASSHCIDPAFLLNIH